MAHVVVFIPGIMGSVLMLGKEVIWPGPITSLVLPYAKMIELLNPNLVATDCIRSFVLPQYSTILDDLTTCGFDESSGTLVVAAYDWRKTIENAAQTLAERIGEIVKRHGTQVEISLVAHSMGGLVSRFLLESGNFSSAPGWANVKRLVTLATPHRGATVALRLVLGFEKKLFLSADQVLQISSDSRYPSAYQLLPRPGEPIAWDGSGTSDMPVLDIYDPAIAARLGLNPQNLDRAKAFHASLDSGQRPAHVRYFCFSGNRQNTAAYVQLKPRSANRLLPAAIEQDDAGDGTVPIWSSTLPNTQFLYVAGEHGTIYKTGDLRKTLAVLLGHPGVLAAGVPTEIALRSTVVEPQDFIHASLKLGEATTQLSGRIAVERLEFDNTGVIIKTTPSTPTSVKYDGPVIENLSVVFEAPAMRGHYRIAYYADDASSPSSSVELIVQEPKPIE
jgi:pimeloyl-ACP methyl ester carboxylesterase